MWGDLLHHIDIWGGWQVARRDLSKERADAQAAEASKAREDAAVSPRPYTLSSEP